MQCLVELSFYVFSMHYLLGLAFLWPSSLLRLMPFMLSCLLGLQQRVKRLSDLLLSVADKKLFRKIITNNKHCILSGQVLPMKLHSSFSYFSG